MAKIKYDVSDVEDSPDFDTPIPVGVYTARITEAEQTVSSAGNDMIRVVLEIMKGDWKGRKLWEYITMTDAASWKMKQFVTALGKRIKGTLDTDELIGAKLLVRVKHDTNPNFNDGEPTAKVGSLQAIPEEQGDEPEEDEPEEEGDDDEEEDYNAWSVPDLKTEAKARGLSQAGTKKTLVKRLQEDDDNGDDDEPF